MSQSVCLNRCYWMIIACCMALAAGCAKPPAAPQSRVFQHTVEEVSAALDDAENDLNVLISLAAPKKYPTEFTTAENALREAKMLLHADAPEIDGAYAAAQESRSATQSMLRQIYAEMAESRAVIKRELEQIAEDDPDFIDQQIIAQLEELLDDYDAEQTIDAGQLARDAQTLKQIEYNAKKNLGRTFESDVSFGAGEYELSDKGKEAIHAYYQEVLTAKQQFRALFPNDSLTVTVKVIGYADQVGILSDTKLYQQLTNGAEHLPGDLHARNTFLNQRLSELRAKAIADYMKDLILQESGADGQLIVEQVIEGAGEKLPPNLAPPHPYQDPRRRICRIYCWMSTR